MSLWVSKADLLLIASHGSLASNYNLPGHEDLEKKWPGISQKLGMFIKAQMNWKSKERYHLYHLLVSPGWPKSRLGLFQIRGRIDQPISNDVLRMSFAALVLWMDYHPQSSVALAIPITPETSAYTRQLAKFGVELWDTTI